MFDTLFERNFIPWKFYPKRAVFEPGRDGTYRGPRKEITKLTLVLKKPDPETLLRPLAGSVDESYELALNTDGTATIAANSTIGLVRGLTTMTQLFFKHSDGQVYTKLAPVKIFDAPKFPHRGLNMDVSRSYYPVKDIKRQIDALGYTKFNRLHLHITDSQSWPLVIPDLPWLTWKGAYQYDMIYTPTDISDIQYYAALHGISVVIETDMPGHTTSIGYGYPNLITAFEEDDWATYAAQPPSGTLKLNSQEVFVFLEKLWNDLLPRLKPLSAYYHTGGDEVNKNAYRFDETVNSSDPAVLQPYMQSFVNFNHDAVRHAGMVPIVWEEMLLEWNLTLGRDVVVQTWQSSAAVQQVVAKGHKALVGNYNFWYLDCGQGQWIDFPPDSSEGFWPYADYCSPRKNWRLIYSLDPLDGIPANQTHLVIGGEAHIWGEQTDAVNVDRMVWPRAAAVAEVLWSGAKDAEGRNRSQVEASPRLAEMRERLVTRGVGSEPVHMPYCTMEDKGCIW
ncbi:hypothetical protein P152DRAFT_467564 [Eremomyces bilateralis CBS 781.70]|uniref:Beta-hexosaminidase n=1 Tax=Eremomyces bilateralis CBS 781.70 TaxID=1392243 RepID=A0A6G1FZ49_9PEZI|nr:uncharacterized protein P152DRAFT_467564 [Eremomyces bilateralis CBS 781.70]KAF1810839.1 hypothetical protein P152DRAFT_467564 [Eremomyces bilateralis CBS 781.70]